MDVFTPFWERDKAWGQVLHCFSHPNAAVSLLDVRRGKRSSIHYHAKRHNDFVVEAGVICVESWPGLRVHGSLTVDRLPEPKQEILRAGDTCSVPWRVLHRFRVVESGRVVEFYWGTNVRLDDIERLDVGGHDDLKGIA